MKIPPTKLSLKDDNTYTINGSQKKKNQFLIPSVVTYPYMGSIFDHRNLSLKQNS